MCYSANRRSAGQFGTPELLITDLIGNKEHSPFKGYKAILHPLYATEKHSHGVAVCRVPKNLSGSATVQHLRAAPRDGGVGKIFVLPSPSGGGLGQVIILAQPV